MTTSSSGQYYKVYSRDASRYSLAARVNGDDVPYNALIRGEVDPKRVFTFRYKSGKRIPGRAVWSDGGDLLLSASLADQLSTLTGWRPQPARLVGENERASRIVVLTVTGRCAPFLPTKSRLRAVSATQAVPVYVGMHFDFGAGRDDFMVPSYPNWGHVFVSERATDALRKLRLDTLELMPCDEVVMRLDAYRELVEQAHDATRK